MRLLLYYVVRVYTKNADGTEKEPHIRYVSGPYSTYSSALDELRNNHYYSKEKYQVAEHEVDVTLT